MFSNLLLNGGCLFFSPSFFLSSHITLYTYNPHVYNLQNKAASHRFISLFFQSVNLSVLFVFWCSFLEPFRAFWHPLSLLSSFPICFSISGWLLPCPALWTWRISQWTFRPVPCSLKAVSLFLFCLFLLSHFTPFYLHPLPDFFHFAWLVKCLTLLHSKR